MFLDLDMRAAQCDSGCLLVRTQRQGYRLLVMAAVVFSLHLLFMMWELCGLSLARYAACLSCKAELPLHRVQVQAVQGPVRAHLLEGRGEPQSEG